MALFSRLPLSACPRLHPEEPFRHEFLEEAGLLNLQIMPRPVQHRERRPGIAFEQREKVRISHHAILTAGNEE